MIQRLMSGSPLPRPFSESLTSQQATAPLIVRVYNNSVLAFAQFAMHVLVFLFFLGLAGSSVVVVISFVEDLNELLGE